MTDNKEAALDASKDEKEIEALIQKELDALGENDLDDLDATADLTLTGSDVQTDTQEIDAYNDSISQYLDFIKRNDKKVKQNIIESQQLIKGAHPDKLHEQDALFAKKLKLLLDDEDDCSGSEDLLHLRSQALAELEKDDVLNDQQDSNLTIALYQPGMMEEIEKLEKEQSKKLKDLLLQQEEQKQTENEVLTKLREDMAVEEKKLEEKRVQKILELEAAIKKAGEKEKELSKVENKAVIDEIEQQLQEKIKEIEFKREEEEKAFLKLKAMIEDERANKILEAVLMIQKFYRGHMARKIFGEKILELRSLRKKREQIKFEEMIRAKEQKRKEEEKRRLEKLERERLEKDRAKKEKLKNEKLEKEKLERRMEIERLEKEKLKKEKLEKERLEEERLEKERLEKERMERELLQKERLEKEHLERERLEKERLEKERLEKERLEKDRLEKERLEKERLHKERLEKERVEKERLEKEKLEIERLEKKRLEKERLEKDRLEKERLEKERLHKERLEKERLEKERLEKERLDKERLEKERVKKDKVEKDRLEKDRLERERLEQQRLDKERLEKEIYEGERLEKEKLENGRLMKERVLSVDIESQKLVEERVGKSKLKNECSKEENVNSEKKNRCEFNEQIVEMKDLKGKIPIKETKEDGKTGLRQLPQQIENMRKQWADSHLIHMGHPIEDPSELRGKARSRTRLKKSLESVPELGSSLISEFLQDDVTRQSCRCIVLNNLDGVRFKGIEQLPNIEAIKMTDCRIEAVECIENLCFLTKLDLSSNKIDYLSLCFNTSLRELSLRGNELSSTTGLEQLVNLQVLDLSSNRITRVGPILSCKQLHYLDISENHLISLKGIEELRNLNELRASCNHLGNAREVEELPLLTILDLHSNSINSLMKLNDHVLLRELDLHENDIACLDVLRQAWLPSLQRINVAGNSIDQLPPLNHLMMLESIDLRDNVIKDCLKLLPGVHECKQLSILRIAGNPVNDTPGLRQMIAEELPSLLCLDDIKLSGKPKNHSLSSFEMLCIDQSQQRGAALRSVHEDIRNLDSMKSNYFRELRKFEIEKKYREQCITTLLRHLKEHEQFGLEIVDQQPEDDSTKELGVDGAQEPNEVYNTVIPESQVVSGARTSEEVVTVASEDITEPFCAQEPDHILEKEFTSKLVENEEVKLWTVEEEKAAVKIQANFRGFRVRKILLTALEGSRQDMGQFGDYDDDDFNYDQEVDLTAFDFDEDGHDWGPSNTPQLPSRIPVLPPSTKQQDETKGEIPADVPKFAWQSLPRTPEPSLAKPIEKLNLGLSPEENDRSSTVAETVASRRKDELISEWGFQSSATANLMLKRAKKMNAASRKKNLLDLAADKRYELFKKLQEAQPNIKVRPPNKKKPNSRVEYFSAHKGRESQLSASDVSTERDFKQEMTYSWVCNQAVLHSEEYHDIIDEQQQPQKRDQKPKSGMKSENRPDRISLPYLDPAIIAGKSLSLVVASRVASNPALASNQPKSPSNLGESQGEKSKSAPDPSQRSPHVFTTNDSPSSRSSSADSRRRKKR